jgi:hypothetical protein
LFGGRIFQKRAEGVYDEIFVPWSNYYMI